MVQQYLKDRQLGQPRDCTGVTCNFMTCNRQAGPRMSDAISHAGASQVRQQVCATWHHTHIVQNDAV